MLNCPTVDIQYFQFSNFIKLSPYDKMTQKMLPEFFGAKKKNDICLIWSFVVSHSELCNEPVVSHKFTDQFNLKTDEKISFLWITKSQTKLISIEFTLNLK